MFGGECLISILVCQAMSLAKMCVRVRVSVCVCVTGGGREGKLPIPGVACCTLYELKVYV